MFLALDVNGDGTLSLEEIEVGLRGKANKEQILQLLQAADTDGSGDINYTEFIAATIGANLYMNEAYLRQVFNMFDKDKSGSIDKDEVVALISGEQMQNIVTKEAIEQCIADIDANGDG